MTWQCIICGSKSNIETIEHIIPRSLGNIYYILPKGIVCRKCNNKFSRFESTVLSSPIFIVERKKSGNVPAHQDELRNNPIASDWQRFVIKIAYEAFFKSKPKIWNELPHSEIVDFLLHRRQREFLTEKIDENSFTWDPIPGWLDRWRLKNIGCRIYFGTNDKNQLGVIFQYGTIRLKARIK